MKTINTMMLTLAGAMLALSLPLPLAAQANSPVSLVGDVKVEKRIPAEDGTMRIELAEPTSVVPGDRLVFGTDFANNGSEAVSNFNVTNPLPAAVRLAPDADPALVVSVDMGKTWGVLGDLAVTLADGTTRPAAHEDVTHVRWMLASIAPGEKGRLTYPAIIR